MVLYTENKFLENSACSRLVTSQSVSGCPKISIANVDDDEDDDNEEDNDDIGNDDDNDDDDGAGAIEMN